MTPLLTIFCLASVLGLSKTQSFLQPEQIRLSYTGDAGSMLVTWVTLNKTRRSLAELGSGRRLSRSAEGTQRRFVDGGPEGRAQFVHRVRLGDLRPATQYLYHVGSDEGWSGLRFFTAPPEGADWSPRFVVYGDFGLENAQSLGRIQQKVQRGHYDMALHVGDQWWRAMEPIASYIPYMVIPGNHEESYNFSNYVNRVSMPGWDDPNRQSLFYSFDLGPVHVVAFNTEFYYYTEYGWHQIANQYAWLENDLKQANANRDKVPWIITMAHKPPYCSNEDRFCEYDDLLIRKGLPLTGGAFCIETLLFRFGVDLSLWGHLHDYERFWPVFNNTVYKGGPEPYVDPPAPASLRIYW